MLTLDIPRLIKNHVISTWQQHHLDENFDIVVFDDKEIKEFVDSKMKSKVQTQVPGFFSRGKAVYVKMHKRSNSSKDISPEEVLRKFVKLIKDGIFANPDSTRDLVGDKTIVTANASHSDDSDKIDNYYFAGFKLKS